jgi:cytochrome c553
MSMSLGRLVLLIAASVGAALLVCTSAAGQSQPFREKIADALPATNSGAAPIDRRGQGWQDSGRSIFTTGWTHSKRRTPTIANPPAPRAAPTAGAERGETIFLAGDPEHAIPPCQGCRGADAGGTSIATDQYAAHPSLRGQYSVYLAARLTSFHSRLPHDTTNDFIMGEAASTLDRDSIQAVAAWLGSLAPSGHL